MRILITGNSGFIGTQLSRYLHQQGYSLCGYDLTVPVAPQALESFRLGNILDYKPLSEYVEEICPDAIIHLAASCDLTDYRKDALGLEAYAANIEGTRNVVRVANASPSIKRVIFTSTQLVSEVGHQPSSLEDCRPSTFYGESKLRGEKIVHDSAGSGYVWSIVRPTSIWGPEMSQHYVRFIDYVVQGKYFHTTDKPLYKSYGYIENALFQYQRILTAPSDTVDRKTFYIADYEPLSLRDYANLLQVKLGARPLRSFPEKFCRLAARTGDVIERFYPKFPFNSFRLNNILTEYVYDMSETESVCGALPVSFEEGVDMTVEWYNSLSARSSSINA